MREIDCTPKVPRCKGNEANSAQCCRSATPIREKATLIPADRLPVWMKGLAHRKCSIASPLWCSNNSRRALWRLEGTDDFLVRPGGNEFGRRTYWVEDCGSIP